MKFNILQNKKSLTFALVGLVLVVIIIALVASSMQPAQPTEPDYQTVLPAEKSIEELGGWKLSSPPNNDPVFSYSDSLDQIAISVSQQPIPKSFEGDIDSKVAELAEQNNATTELTVDNLKVYIGSSAKGPQSVIFVKDELLVFIKSQERINNDSWSEYIRSLN